MTTDGNGAQELNGKASKLLFLLGEKEKASRFDLWNKYIGPGRKNLIKRIVFLREKYLWYVFQKITKYHFFKKRTTTFWGKDIAVTKDGSLRYGFIFDPPEFRLIKFFIKHLKEDDVFYDIGANVGFYSLLAGELIIKGEIHCFEPMPDIFRMLKSNVDGLMNVHENEIALSDREDDMVLYEVGDKAGFGTTISDVAKTYQGEIISEIHIKSTTLHAYLRNHRKPTIIKLDVEGGESKVIDGGVEFLKNDSPIVVMEAWGGEKGERFSRGAIDKLHTLGYESWVIDYEGGLKSMPDIDLVNLRDFENFVFCKKDAIRLRK
jgi:FkbM family methyltransferase